MLQVSVWNATLNHKRLRVLTNSALFKITLMNNFLSPWN